MVSVKADRVDDKIIIEAGFDDRNRCTQIPGAKWDFREEHWTARLTWATAKQLRYIFQDRLEIGDELLKWGVEEFQSRVGPALELREAVTVNDPSGLCDGLYPFQQAGAQFLIASQCALLGDEMGSGKTIQAIAAARSIEALPALVVCPNSTKHNWRREIEKWWPGVPVYVVEGTKKQRSETILKSGDGWCVINWECIRLHSRLARYGSIRLSEEERTPKELNQIPWQLVIADEAHRMKDPTSKQTRSLWAISE